MVLFLKDVYKRQALGLSFLVSAIAIIPKSGIPTPVTQKPIAADQKWSPAAWPNAGGKIRLPAPKKDEKSINPTGKISQNVRFCFIKSLPS